MTATIPTQQTKAKSGVEMLDDLERDIKACISKLDNAEQSDQGAPAGADLEMPTADELFGWAGKAPESEPVPPDSIAWELANRECARLIAEEAMRDDRPPGKAKRQSKPDANADDGRKTQADMLVELAKGVEVFYWDDIGYASFTIKSHQETHRINSKAFRAYLRGEFYRVYRRVPNAEAMSNAVALLDAKALFDGESKPVYLRLAAHNGRIYWDLANDQWQIIEIGPDGWRIIEADKAPVRFWRARGMQALPTPEKGGDLATLKKFINYPDHAAWALHATWLIAALRANARAFPILILNGEQGSAKTTAAKMSRRLIDPNLADVRRRPREDRDLFVSAKNGWVCAFDNLSGLPRDFSDTLCSLATGAGMGARELYENDEETLFNAARPIIVNGIDDLAERADIVDRGVFIELPPIPEEERRDDETLWADFEAELPKLVGALATAVADALKNLPNVKLKRLPRMADFMKWGAAANIGGDGVFITAYQGNRRQANDLALRANLIAAYLADWYQAEEPITITLTDLLTELTAFVRGKLAATQGCKPERVSLPKDWPTTERKLSNELRRCAPNLRKAGIQILDAGLDNQTRKAQRRFQRCEEDTPKTDVFEASEASEASKIPQTIENTEDNLRRNVRSFENAQSCQSFATSACEASSSSDGSKPSYKASEAKPNEQNNLGDTPKLSKLPKLSKHLRSACVTNLVDTRPAWQQSAEVTGSNFPESSPEDSGWVIFGDDEATSTGDGYHVSQDLWPDESRFLDAIAE